MHVGLRYLPKIVCVSKAFPFLMLLGNQCLKFVNTYTHTVRHKSSSGNESKLAMQPAAHHRQLIELLALHRRGWEEKNSITLKPSSNWGVESLISVWLEYKSSRTTSKIVFYRNEKVIFTIVESLNVTNIPVLQGCRIDTVPHHRRIAQELTTL